MSDKESRAQEAASQYRVIKNKDGVFNLKRKENPSSIGFDIKHQAIMLNIDATPAELIWTADADKAPSFYVAFLNATEMRIGNSDDKGCSDLEENSIFVIDGENIQNLPLKRIRVLSAENYKEAEEKIAQARGVIAEISKNEFASAKLSHIPKYDDYDELLLLTVGLPQDVFNKLVENNLSGRTTNVSLGGMCGALSSSPWHSSARDMIIQAGTSVSFGIDSITIKSQGIVKQKQAEDIAIDDEEIYLKESESNMVVTALAQVSNNLAQVSNNIVHLRSTIVKTAWILSITILFSLILFCTN